jgi:hypothetical protein
MTDIKKKQHTVHVYVVNFCGSVWSFYIEEWVRVMVFNITFNNISVISWRLVLLVEETGLRRENH